MASRCSSPWAGTAPAWGVPGPPRTRPRTANLVARTTNRPQLTARKASVRIRPRFLNLYPGGRCMKHTSACSATLAISLLILLSGCGGGGGGGSTQTPATPTTLAAPAPTVAPAAAAPTTTQEGQAGEDDDFPPPLLAWAEADPEEGDTPLTVQFKADIEGGGPPLKYKWSFGDGTPDSTEASPKHTYDKPGKYRAD